MNGRAQTYIASPFHIGYKAIVLQPIFVSLRAHRGDRLTPAVAADDETDATDENFVRVAICSAAAKLDKARRCLKKFFLGDYQCGTCLVKEYYLMVQGFKISQFWFWAGCTICLEHTVRVAHHPFREIRFARLAFAFDNEELVPGANFVELLVELIHLGEALKGLQCAVE